MKKTNIKLILLSILTIIILGTPSIIYFFQRGAESNIIFEDPIEVNYPLGTMVGAITNSNETKEIAKDLGIKLGRIDISWKNVQKPSGIFNFTQYDRIIGNITSLGISTLGVLNYDHNNVETDPIGNTTDKYIAYSDVPKFVEYVNQTISHFYPNITHYEIWNEPNLPLHWNGPWNEFFYLFQETMKHIAKLRIKYPKLFIVAPAISDMGHAFLKQLFQEGYLQQCDAISFHTYHQFNEAIIYRMWQLRDLCRTFNYTGEFWLSEAGFPTGGTYIHVIDEKDQGDRLIKSISLAIAIGIDREIWYTFKDSEHDEPLNSESYFGLLNNDLSYKTGAYAFKFFNDYCANSTMRKDLVRITGSSSKKNLFAFLYQKEDLASSLVVWYTSAMTMREKIKIELDIPAVPGSVISHSFNNISQPFTENSIKLGYDSLVLTFISEDSNLPINIHVKSSRLKILAYCLLGIGIVLPVSVVMIKKFNPQILKKMKSLVKIRK